LPLQNHHDANQNTCADSDLAEAGSENSEANDCDGYRSERLFPSSFSRGPSSAHPQ